jgi:hypothetical protein
LFYIKISVVLGKKQQIWKCSCSELKHVDVTCLTEHWQSDQKLRCTNIVDFKLVSAFCRSSNEHGGSSIYIRNGLETREIHYFAGISEEKTFEMSLTELPEYKLLIVCIYRSPDGQVDKFLDKLESVVQKLLMKGKILILCGDWNIDLLHEGSYQKDLTGLLLRYNLVNTVQSPTRISNSTSTLIDVIIINKKDYVEPATVMELGVSDHQAQVLSVLRKTPTSINRRVLKRRFGNSNIREFQYLLEKETWQEVLEETDINVKTKVFMNIVVHLFDIAFPLELRHKKKSSRNGWITQGIKISSKKMRVLNKLKMQVNLTEDEKNLYYQV